jgi:hypothetical protein
LSKRFTDTMKYRKGFIRGLQGPYKVLWDFLYHECDHAGIWEKDFEIAQILIGKDLPINEEKAIEYFNAGEERITVLDDGKKWFIRPFLEFQYGLPLDPENRVHRSVLKQLEKFEIKGLTSPLEGAKDKDKDTDKNKSKDIKPPVPFEEFYGIYPKKQDRKKAEEIWESLCLSREMWEQSVKPTLEAWKKTEEWLKEKGKYAPMPSTWLRRKRWEDQVPEEIKPTDKYEWAR